MELKIGAVNNAAFRVNGTNGNYSCDALVMVQGTDKQVTNITDGICSCNDVEVATFNTGMGSGLNINFRTTESMGAVADAISAFCHTCEGQVPSIHIEF